MENFNKQSRTDYNINNFLWAYEIFSLLFFRQYYYVDFLKNVSL